MSSPHTCSEYRVTNDDSTCSGGTRQPSLTHELEQFCVDDQSRRDCIDPAGARQAGGGEPHSPGEGAQAFNAVSGSHASLLEIGPKVRFEGVDDDSGQEETDPDQSVKHWLVHVACRLFWCRMAEGLDRDG